MIIVDTALAKREAEGRPIKVGLVGAGYMGAALTLQIESAIPGMQVAGIAARRPDQALGAYAQVMDADQIARPDSIGAIEDAIARGQRLVTDDPTALARAEGLDAVLEVTGSMDFALSASRAALSSGKHLILMNAELDGTVGPLLAELGRRAGQVVSNADGDQPVAEMNLLRFVRSIGLKPMMAGNIKGLQDTDRNPDTQVAFAAKWGQKPANVASYADGTKMSFEQAIVANATGMTVARRGMLGPDPTGKDPTLPLRPIEEYLPLLTPHLDPDGPGLVDYVVGASPGPGVFVIGYCDQPRQQHFLRQYKMGDGPYYMFTTPYHLCHFEAPLSVARAVDFGDAGLMSLGAPQVGVVATAKRDLKTGETIDEFGGFLTYGEAETSPNIAAERLLPMGLAQGARIARPIAKGATLTFDDVTMPAPRDIDIAYAEQDAMFRLSRTP